MVMFAPGDRSQKIGMRLDSLVVTETWGEIWRATHDKYGRVLVVAYKRDPGKNLFLACRNAFANWKSLAEAGTPGLLKIHKIVASGKIPMLLAEDPGGESAHEFFESESATLKKTARMVRACCRTVRRLQNESLTPVGITPHTIFRREGAEDYPAWLLPVTPGVAGDEVRLGDGRYVSPEALRTADISQSNADVYSLAWIWAEMLARNVAIEHDEARLGSYVHYPRAKGVIRKALQFRDGRYPDPKKFEVDAEQWIENDAVSDRQDFDRSMAERKESRSERRRQRKEEVASAPAPPDAAGLFDGEAGESFEMADADFGGGGFGSGPDGDEAERGAELPSFAKGIPSLAGPSPRRSAPAAPESKPPDRAGRHGSAATPGSTLIPTLFTAFFVFMIVSAFTAGVWILLRGGGEVRSPDRPVADAGPDSGGAEGNGDGETAHGAPGSGGSADPGETATDAAAATPSVTPPTPRAAEPAAVAAGAPSNVGSASLDALVETFREANSSGNIEIIGRLYYQAAEFAAVESILRPLVAEDRETATLQFVPRLDAPPATEGLSGIGTLRVTTTAINLEIPVGSENGTYFLTSVGRVGASWTPPPTPVPTEAPLTFAATASGSWTPDERRRAARIGLGQVARAELVIRLADEPGSPATILARISNPGAATLFYQFAVAVRDDEGRFLAGGGGGGSVEAGGADQEHEAPLPLPDSVLADAARYEAVWYEEEFPLGLVGGAIRKNPRIPVGFARAYGFELGEDSGIKGLVYTDYANNQKIVAAPGMLENSEDRSVDALYAVALLDAGGALISAQSQRAELPARDVFAFDQILFYLPQTDYARVHAYEAVIYMDGVEAGRAGAELPGDGSEEEEPAVGLPAASVTATPSPTPTPLPAAQAAPPPEAVGTPDAEIASIDQALASLRGAEAGAEEAAPQSWDEDEGGWEAAGEGGAPGDGWPDEEALPEETRGLLSRFRALNLAGQIVTVVFGYFIAAFCFQKILEKSGKHDSALLAWVPGANWVLVPWVISGRPLLFAVAAAFVPCLGLLAYILMWHDVCRARGKHGAWAFVAAFVPFIGIPYLAFSE